MMKGLVEMTIFFYEDYADLVGDSEFDRYERPSSRIVLSTCIVMSTHIDQTTLHDQINLNHYELNFLIQFAKVIRNVDQTPNWELLHFQF